MRVLVPPAEYAPETGEGLSELVDVGPGGTVTLEFTLINLDSSRAAAGITFTDDLDAALSVL